MQKSKKQKRSVNNSFASALVKGSLLGMAVFIVFLAIFSLVIIKSDIANHNFYILVLISSAVAALLSATTASCIASRARLIVGMLAVIIITLVQFFVLLCFNNSALSVKVYFMFPIDIVSGFLGCIAGTNIRI